MINFPVEKPVTTTMIFLAVFLLGMISWSRLPQELFPSLEFPQISIVTRYEGAGPEEAEKLISKMIEESVGTVRNVKRVSSISKEGMSLVIIEFRWGTDMNFAALEVREKVDLVKERLPRDSQEPVVLKFNPFKSEAMVLSASYNRDEDDPWKLVELRQFCKKNIKDELERIEGVAKVELRGGEQKEILVEVDKGRILANQLSLLDIIKTLRETNITYPAGMVKEENYEYMVKTVGEFKNISEIGDVLLIKEETQADQQRSERQRRNARQGSVIYLRDVASISEAIKDPTGYSRFNQRGNVSLSIFPQSGSNLLNVSKLVRKKIKELELKIPKDVNVEIIYDQSDFIKASLQNIYNDAMAGGIISFIIILIFLKDIVASAIILVALPISILFALSFMYFADISINTMSLGGLALGVGMVIDNSNIVLESIMAYLKQHPDMPKKELIKEAAKREVGAVVGGTFTTVAIFLPFIFVSGVAGQLFKQMALTITFSMIASAMVALFLVPRLALFMRFEKYKKMDFSMRILDYIPPKLEKFLSLPRKVTWRYLFIYLFVGLVMLYFIPKEFMPKLDERRFTLNLTLPPQTTLSVTNNLVRRIETYLFSVPEVESVVSNVGSSGEGVGDAIESLGVNQARIIAKLAKRGRPSTAVVVELNDEIKKWQVEGLEAEFVTQQGMFGSAMGSSSGLMIELKGMNLAALKKKSDEIKADLAKMPQLYGLKTIPADLVPELKLNIDREKASIFGLNVQDISATLLAAIKGYEATKFKLKDEEYPIRVRLRPEDRSDLSRIGELTVYSPFGRNIQLLQISELVFVKTMPEIRRIEGQRTYLMMANVRGSFDSAVKDIRELLDDVIAPSDDMAYNIAGETLALQESMSSAVFAVVLAIVIIYMILASQFESLLQPLIIMVTIPMGLTGAVYALFLSFKTLNSVSMQGMIILIGLVVNGAIVLVETYNQMRKAEPHRDLRELVFEGTVDRVRPILMTTLTTILGIFPLVFGGSTNATSSMAVAICGGETLRMALTILFVPSAYLFVEEWLESRRRAK
ncbi:MAG: hypothetical protein A2278_00865 [Elusimicrobia bacterium RIFOXYA12_FULL_49_49]|nr:MAG: hypothetical protein A2278_00865 [Elusimicrobia bacterium RIFOXYA12_FULL_49_49]